MRYDGLYFKAIVPDLKLKGKIITSGAFTLLTSRFLKSRHFDPTIYTCANNREVSVLRNFAIFWLVVRMCDHRLQCMHSCMQSMQYAWGPRARVASSPEVPKVTWWKIATFLRLPFTLANFAWNFATFQKNRTPAWYFSGDVSRVFMRSC